jgi:hypothetical protein
LKIYFFITLILFVNVGFGQNKPDSTVANNITYKVVNGDTSYYAVMKDIYITADPTPSVFKNARNERQYWRLVRNIKIVYPYAKMARQKLDSMNLQFQKLHTESERKAYAKEIEKQLEKQITPVLLQLTYSQGDILIKLIDRETGQSPYQLVKDIRGNLRAVFYQTVARIFTHNLKDKYDKEGNDKTIEMIVQGIEAGFY